MRRNLAVGRYQAAHEKYQENGTKPLDWRVINDKNKEQAKQNMVNTYYALKLRSKGKGSSLELVL